MIHTTSVTVTACYLLICLPAGRPVLVVPWVVMQELDALKKSSSGRLADKARNAIRFLHDSFESQHPRVRGQTMDEVCTKMRYTVFGRQIKAVFRKAVPWRVCLLIL